VYSNPHFQASGDAGSQTLDICTGTEEVIAAHELTRLFAAFNKPLSVKMALLFSWDEARERDLIFVGAQLQNQPVRQMPHLEKFDFERGEMNYATARRTVRNLTPVGGEPEEFVVSEDMANWIEYPIVGLLPGTASGHRVLILAGTTTYGTEAASAFLCKNSTLSDLLKRLNCDRAPVPPFEALLELDVRSGAPSEARIRMLHKRAK
jgi:hypothetical protein